MVILSKWARQANVAYRMVKYNGIGINTGNLCLQKIEGEGTLKNKLPTLSKKDKANGKKIKQVV
ncbi:hypothetical protein GGD38_005103 [Chitinophagaceae bacterium OAS944]|nr:hypothetical protein [Chitinophagaceae bacterium OAS944]